MKTYKLELKVDFQDEDKYKIIEQQLERAAREILAVAVIIQEKRKPQIALHSEDFFKGNEELEIVSEEMAE